jgi:hypothetical protein
MVDTVVTINVKGLQWILVMSVTQSKGNALPLHKIKSQHWALVAIMSVNVLKAGIFFTSWQLSSFQGRSKCH